VGAGSSHEHGKAGGVTSEVRVAIVERARGGAPDGPALPATRPLTAPASFHVMAKPTGAICNLDCAYCYYLEKESLYPGDRFRMGDDVLENYIRQVIEAQTASVVTIAWQGGEPTLMGLRFFERAVEIARRYVRPGQRLQHTMQTNATLLTEDWARFLAGHEFLVGVSIDGPPALHDAYRVDKRGRPSYARVARGLELLRSHGVEYNILCTVHAANADAPREVYRLLRDDCGASFIQFIPIVEHIPTDDEPWAVSERSVTAGGWGSFLTGVFDEWVVRDVGKVFVQSFDAALASFAGAPPGICVFAETCGDAVALEHNGDVYSCDHFVYPENRLGNIMRQALGEMVESPQQIQFGQAKNDTLPKYCRQCEVRFACNGECPKHRFATTPDGEAGLNYLCAGYKKFFTHIDPYMQFMAAQLRQQRAPANVMEWVRMRDAAALQSGKPGRNGPCACGSGKKFKRCCGASASSQFHKPIPQE